MQNLAPIEPREAQTGGRTGEGGRRGESATGGSVPWGAVAIAVGLAVGCALLMNWRDLADSLSRHALLQAELALCAGAIPGFLLTRINRRPSPRRASTLDDLVARGVLIPAAPAPGYTHYLPCSLLARDATADVWTAGRPEARGRSRRNPVTPGVLYAGPAGIRFQPQAAPMAEATDSAFEIGPVRVVSATPVALACRRVTRFAHRMPPYAMLVRWPTGQALFAVPSIGDTLPRLHDCLDLLRWGSPKPSPEAVLGDTSTV
jgi:hypothetical protein